MQYFILMYLPFNDGGGVASIIGSITSFSLAVDTLFVLLRYACCVSSRTLKIRCFVSAEANMIEMSVNGANLCRIVFSKNFMAFTLLSSTRSHNNDKSFLVLLNQLEYVYILSFDTSCSIYHKYAHIRILNSSD